MDAPQELIAGIHLLNKGDLAGARRAAEAAAIKAPRHPAVMQLLGVLHCHAREFGVAAQLLRRSLELDPANRGTRLNLGNALLALRRFDEAEAVCGGDDPDLARLRGDICKAAGRLPQAIAAYRVAVAARAEFFEAWNNLGNALRDAGDVDGAIAALERASALRPDNAVCLLNLGRACAAGARLEQAAAALQKACALAPANAEAQCELGAVLAASGRHADSLPPLLEAARLAPADARMQVFLGITLAALDRHADAEAAYARALTLDPRSVSAYQYYGILLEESNRLRDLRELLEQAHKRGVAERELAVLRARLLKRDGRPDEALELLADQPGGTRILDTLRAQLRGELCEQRGDAAAAFAAFAEMNRLRATEPGARTAEGARYREHVARLARITTPEWVAGWTPATPDLSTPPPAFLVGFPRSGTTLLDTILLGHPEVFVLEESPLLPAVAAEIGDPANVALLDTARIDALRARYLEGLRSIPGAAQARLVIDKSPQHITLTAFIHRLFPDARFVFALRHPCDVVLSCFMQNLWANEVAANFLDLGDAARLYDHTLRYWETCNAVLPLRVHTLRYESLVQDIEAEVRVLLDFLGLPWNAAVLDYRATAFDRGRIGTPSYAQVTERLYTRACGRWERYRDHFGEALPLLAPWVERLGYPAP